MPENILNMEGSLESNSPHILGLNRGWVSSPGSQDESVPFRFACPVVPAVMLTSLAEPSQPQCRFTTITCLQDGLLQLRARFVAFVQHDVILPSLHDGHAFACKYFILLP